MHKYQVLLVLDDPVDLLQLNTEFVDNLNGYGIDCNAESLKVLNC